MRKAVLSALVAIAATMSVGCMHGRKSLLPGKGSADCQPTSECDDGQVIRVKAPPQIITIEQPGPASSESAEKAPAAPKKESAPVSESAPRPKRDTAESAPGRSADSEIGAAAGLALASQSLALAGQVQSLRRTTAMTQQLGTVNPGSSGLGFGLRWIHIPIPCPRIFSIQETPSVTVPLSEANLMPVGGFGAQAGIGATGRQGVTRDELALLVEQELSAKRQLSNAVGPAAKCPPADDEEKKKLEKKLAETEAKLERLTKTLNALDEKLSPAKDPEK